MLKWIKIKDLTERQRLILEFQPEDSAWIVPDIKTKLYLQTELLKKHSFLSGPCVMRARELYEELFHSSSLPWHLTSDLFVEQLMSEFLESSATLGVPTANRGVKVFFEVFNAFLPAFLHPEGLDLLKEWMDKTKKSLAWRDLFELSQEFFHSLESQKIIHRSGLKALLASQLHLIKGSCFMKQKIFVDLLFSLDFYEVEIFKELGRKMEIYVLSPELHRPHFFNSRSLNIYQQMEKLDGKTSFYSLSPVKEDRVKLDQKKTDHLAEKHTEEISQPHFAQFFKVESKTQLGEVKSALAQSLKWMEQGISPSDIALFAPDMEEYWFALRHCLKKEGIPVQKSLFAGVMEYPVIRLFLASLRMSLKKASFEDLESFAFYNGGEEKGGKNFSSFKARYFYAPEKHYFKPKTNLSIEKKITAREFIRKVVHFWPPSAPDFLLEKVSKLLQDFPMEARLKAGAWLNLLEKGLFSLDVELKNETEEEGRGILALSLNALSSVKSPYVFIMGLEEHSLKPPSSDIIKESERQSLLKDLSFPPCFPNREEGEMGLLWFLKSPHLKEVFLSSGCVNFKGEDQTASSLYLMSELLFSAEEKKIQSELSWDQKKKCGKVSKILSEVVSNEQSKQIEKFISEPKECFFQKQEIRLSPNSIQQFFDCPFKYAAEKIFFASSPPLITRELSPLAKGSTVHKLFEEALRQDLREVDEEKIDQLIEDLEPEEKDLIYKQQKLVVKDYLKKLLKEFFETEKESKSRLPPLTKLKPEVFEAQCQTRWNQTKGELDHEGEYSFQAKIDRIDKDKETAAYVIRDYKSKPGDLTNIPNWLKEGKEELQLSFYAQALQKGLVEGLPEGKVSALFYSFYNKGFLAKGFEEKGSSVEGVMGKGKGFKKEHAVLKQAIQAGNQRLKLIVEEMEQGRFFAQPRDENLCPNCSFKHWCRFKNALF